MIPRGSRYRAVASARPLGCAGRPGYVHRFVSSAYNFTSRDRLTRQHEFQPFPHEFANHLRSQMRSNVLRGSACASSAYLGAVKHDLHLLDRIIKSRLSPYRTLIVGIAPSRYAREIVLNQERVIG